MTSKMNIEEIKKLLEEQQIREIVKSSFTKWCGDRVSVDKIERAWHYPVYMLNVYDKSGWSRATFRRRWDSLVEDGFIQWRGRTMVSGTINTKDWRNRVAELAIQGLKLQGLKEDLEPINGRDLDAMVDDAVLYVVEGIND